MDFPLTYFNSQPLYPYYYTLPVYPTHVKCESCATTTPSTGLFLPTGWYSLESGGVKQLYCSLQCVHDHSTPALTMPNVNV